MLVSHRKPQVCVLGSAEPGSRAYELAAQAGEALAKLGITVVSGCGSPATRVAAERAIQANGLVLSIVPPDQMPPPDWPATVVLPCGMGDARNLLMALAGDACIVIGGRAGTKSEVHLAWLHKRPLLPLVRCHRVQVAIVRQVAELGSVGCKPPNDYGKKWRLRPCARGLMCPNAAVPIFLG